MATATDPDLLARYAAFLKASRRRPRPSVRAIAEEAGISPATAARWLKGQGIPQGVGTKPAPKKKPAGKGRAKPSASDPEPPPPPPDPAGEGSAWQRIRESWPQWHDRTARHLADLERIVAESDDPALREKLIRLTIAHQKSIVDAGLVDGAGEEREAPSAAPSWLLNVAAGWMPDRSHPLKAHQKLILQAPGRWLIVRGGVGTFKTTACLLRILLHCYQHPGQTLAVAASTYSQLRYVFRPLWEQLVPPELYRASWSANTIELPGCRSELWLIHNEHPRAVERVRGASISGWLVLQSEMLRGDAGMKFLQELDSRVRKFGDDDPQDPRYLRITDPNGAGPDRPVNRRFLDATDGAYVGAREPVESEPLPGVAMRRDGPLSVLTIETRPETSVYSAETIEGWRATWPDWQVEQLLKGEFVSAEGRVYETWTELAESVQPGEVTEFWIGMDPGTVRDDGTGKGNLALVVLGRLTDGRWAFIDEWLGGFAGLEALAQRVKGMIRRWGPEKFQAVIRDWGGGPGTPFADYLKHHADVPVLSPAGNSAKWHRVAAGTVLLDTRFRAGTLVVSPACRKLTRDLRQYVQDSDGEPDKKVYDAHLGDAARYVGIRALRHED